MKKVSDINYHKTEKWKLKHEGLAAEKTWPICCLVEVWKNVKKKKRIFDAASNFDMMQINMKAFA